MITTGTSAEKFQRQSLNMIKFYFGNYEGNLHNARRTALSTSTREMQTGANIVPVPFWVCGESVKKVCKKWFLSKKIMTRNRHAENGNIKNDMMMQLLTGLQTLM